MPTSQDDKQAFIRLIKHPVKYRLYLLMKLPGAFFSGLRVREVDETHCTVSVPYRWFTRNPFRSTYFACLSMAAEMSTGVLAMIQVFRHDPPISMLVTGMEASFLKKATGITRFSCKDGTAIRETIRRAVTTGEAGTITVQSTGSDANGETIALFNITWSFKVRSARALFNK